MIPHDSEKIVGIPNTWVIHKHTVATTIATTKTLVIRAMLFVGVCVPHRLRRYYRSTAFPASEKSPSPAYASVAACALGEAGVEGACIVFHSCGFSNEYTSGPRTYSLGNSVNLKPLLLVPSGEL